MNPSKWLDLWYVYIDRSSSEYRGDSERCNIQHSRILVAKDQSLLIQEAKSQTHCSSRFLPYGPLHHNSQTTGLPVSIVCRGSSTHVLSNCFECCGYFLLCSGSSAIHSGQSTSLFALSGMVLIFEDVCEASIKLFLVGEIGIVSKPLNVKVELHQEPRVVFYCRSNDRIHHL